MRGSAFAIEQASRCHQTHSRANAGDGYPTGAPTLQPWDNRRIPLDHIVHAQSSSWNENQIGLADILERQVRSNLNFSITLNRASIGGGRGHVEAWSATRSGKNVP